MMRNAGLVAAVSLIAVLSACSTVDEGQVAKTGNSSNDVAVASPPPPPPPSVVAPSPPPASDDEIVVSSNRSTGSNNYASVTPVTVVSGEQMTRARTGAVRASAPKGGFIPPVIVATDPGREQYDGEEISPVKITSAEPVSTFSVDVDTGAYANSRRFLTGGNLPPRDAVRTEEMINYFRYDYARPESREQPFSVTADMARTPWNNNTRLLRIGLRGYDLPAAERPPANLVFLMDVSGSMGSPDKLPLVKTALAGLADNLSGQDRVSIVVYAGAAGLVLEPTNDPRKIRRALDSLRAGGSTAGGAGLQLAYQIAEDNMIEGGVNRVILATDGDFNVGASSQAAMIEMIEARRDSGITLTTLGFGTGNYNEALMEQVANHGNGNYAYIDTALEAQKVLGDEMSSTLFTIAKDVKIQVEFNPAVVSQYRLVGYENRVLREEDFDNDRVDAGDIGAGHQVTAIYEVVPTGNRGWSARRRYEDQVPIAARDLASEAAHIKLRYKLPDGDTSRLIEFTVPARQLANARQPGGDFAFATAVAAFGQKLRADPLMGDFDYRDIERLAGDQDDYWRLEFIRLASLAGSLQRN